MEVIQAKIAIVGCGPGAPEYLTEAARRTVQRASVLVGSQRLLDTFADHPGSRIAVGADIAGVLDSIARLRAAGERIAVLVSGDPGLFSLAGNVLRRFGADACEVVPGISSVQVAFARLGLDWAEARILSAHGRTPSATATELARQDKLAILAGTGEGLRWSAQLAASLQRTHAAFLCENLTLADERVRAMTPDELAATAASSLSIVVLVKRGE